MDLVLAIYTTILTGIVVALMPVSIGASIFLWRVHAEDRSGDTRVPPPRIRLSFVLAVVGSTGAFAEVYFTVLVLYRVLYGPTPLAFAPVSATVVVLLAIVPLLTAGYLYSLRRRRWTENGKRTPPPFGSED